VGAKKRFVILLERLQELYPDLAEPERLIEAGSVFVDGRLSTNPRTFVPRGVSVVVRARRRLRGAEKLESALTRLAVDVVGTVALDVGAAAGGFTQALLDAGAVRVYAVDVGYGQLIGALRHDPRVSVLERTNLSRLTPLLIPEDLEVITMDLSYLSVSDATPQLSRLRLSPLAQLIALVKPMFELRLAHLPPDARLAEAVERAVESVTKAGWRVVSVRRSSVGGAGGAVEFFLHAVRKPGRRGDSTGDDDG
jgi:23S rRNA (cytidine1920-2'-O)/16S rRNA (cytidine1409-2'-O)-methyltransferase